MFAAEEFGSARAPPSGKSRNTSGGKLMMFPRLHIHKIRFSANLLSYLRNYVQCHNILSEQKF